MKTFIIVFILFLSFAYAQDKKLEVSYSRYTLSNGLNVILHEDHSTPIISVNIWYHVGSANEKQGRTGFAHLFEHLMFEGSGNVPEGKLDQWLEAAGGSFNGSTNPDRTNYFVTVPSNALELVLFLESDRMGYLLDAMTPEKIDGQREVVKNERRQRYENQPYGLAWEIIRKNLYPGEHPYNWPTIGSMADLSAAGYEDVAEFFKIYYAPNNASISIAGDFNTEEVIKLVEKWFGEISKGKPVPGIELPVYGFNEEKIVVYEDKVQLPRLYMVWNTPAQFNPGDGELDLLANILGDGKNSRLYQRLVYELQIAQDVNVFQSSGRLSSQFYIIVTAKSGHNLEEIKKIIQEEIDKIKSENPSEREVQRAVNQFEARFLNRLESVGTKADQLNHYFYFTGNPDYFNEDFSRYPSFSTSDISAAAKTHLSDNKRVILSIVPEGKRELAVSSDMEVK